MIAILAARCDQRFRRSCTAGPSLALLLHQAGMFRMRTSVSVPPSVFTHVYKGIGLHATSYSQGIVKYCRSQVLSFPVQAQHNPSLVLCIPPSRNAV
jgi:hypothetical protein